MKIAVFHYLDSGGAKRALYEQVTRLARCEATSIDLFCLDPEVTESVLDLRPCAARVHTYHSPQRETLARLPPGPSLLPLVRWRDSMRMQRVMARDIDCGGFDAVYATQSHLTQSPLLLRLLKTPCVYYLHEPRRRSFEYAFMHEPIPGRGLVGAGRRCKHRLLEAALKRHDMANIRSADTVLVNSCYTREATKRAYGIDAEVVYPGVDTTLFAPRPERSHNTPYVLAVGALHPAKNHALAVQAVAAVEASRRPLLKLACDRVQPGHEAELATLAERLGVGLDVQRAVSDDALAGLYAGAAATLCMARLEPFGLTVLESTSAGTPVIALNEAGYRETVADGVNGLVVARPDPGLLAAALERVLSGVFCPNPTALHQVAQQHWSWDVAVNALRAALDRATRENARACRY